jgi:phenylpropionate dioxygenase-like ring-hydroxylating dioxygenase large terminal subunit
MSYLRNCWYAAAWAVDLKPGTITARTLLDEPLVFYRDAQGAAVAMDDMCPHRLAPLRMAKLLPTGNLQCSYHGLEFDGKGQCVKNPHGQGRIPSKCQIRTYPLVEKHSMVWIWMGSAPPNESLIPEFRYLDAGSGYDVGRRDTLSMEANYRNIIDNLMDLSHAAYLHDGLLGNSETAWAEIEVRQDGPYIHVEREMKNVRPPKLRDLLFKRDGAPVNMWQHIRWSAPGAVLNDVGTYAVDGERSQFSGQLGCHILTPETATTTHYFTAAARQGPVGATPEEGDEALKAQIAEMRRYAFKEQDDPMLNAQQDNIRRHPGVRPVLLEIDAGPVRCQRHLDTLIAAEKAATTAPAH